MKALLKLAGDRTTVITGTAVIRYDILPWLTATGVMALLYIGIIWVIVGDSTSQTDRMRAAGAVSGLSLYILGFLGVLLAMRKKDATLWVVYIVSVLIFGNAPRFTLSYFLGSNTLLSFMLIVMMVLCVGRIIEYLRMHYGVGLQEPVLTIGGWAVYIILAIICLGLVSSSIADWVVCSINSCRPT